MRMIIVAGHLGIAGGQRERYLAGYKESNRPVARRVPRISQSLPSSTRTASSSSNAGNAVEAFRDGGPSDEQMADIISASVTEYDVTVERRLT